jgi:hypothetical protein
MTDVMSTDLAAGAIPSTGAELGGKPNQGTKPDKRLKENAGATNCPPGMMPDPSGDGCMPGEADAGDVHHFMPTLFEHAADGHEHHELGEAFATDAPWDGSAGRFTDAQYESAAAACDPASAGTIKERCFLPHHEPGGALNVNGMHAAAQRASSVTGRTPEAVSRAKAHLRSHYAQQKEEPPDSIKAALDWHDSVTAAAAPQGPPWRGPLVVESVPTGDGREFAENSITWPDPSEVTMPLQWQKESSHGGTHDVTVSVGRIDRIWRQPLTITNKAGEQQTVPAVFGEGRFDIHPDAVEAARRMDAGMLNGNSINADDISDSTVEYVWDDDPEAEAEGDLLTLLFATPTLIRFHEARLRATTLCDIPAYVEASVNIISEPGSEPLVASAVVLSRRAASPHATAYSHEVWDGIAEEAKLRRMMPPALARAAYAYVDHDSIGDVSRDACLFLHHEISDGGQPGPANLTACVTGMQVVHNSRIPDEDRAAIYAHLAAHLRDAGEEPPPYEPEHALVAHAWQEDQGFHPPAPWFADPKLSVPTPVMVTDAGRVYGLATEWGECHIGYNNECVLPPREAYHERFMTGELPYTCDDGTRPLVGQITAGIGHAAMSLNANRAAEHYDNTDAVVADVAVGNCDLGIWVAGAIRPSAQAARVAALRASGQVSPDWRRIGGQLRMVGLLTVNISGYQLGRARVRTRVASGQIQTMVASGLVSVRLPGPSTADLDRMSMRREMDRLAERVLA